ncbi:unnamed protein product [Hermetia illucens]|uniref:Peptidase S1 domain-containing protein n=1 Tax=Hermetia illucens TaxID=343691 RepID=A0A7R8UH07_HERIL|nr:unnamed protein product [Hermetia illucens]
MPNFSLFFLLFFPALSPYGTYGSDQGDLDRGEYPFVVSLQFAGDYRNLCAGTLLTESLVLSAAHCVEHSFVNNLIVVAGIRNAENWEGGYQKSEVAKVVTPGPYPNPENVNDIAILTLKNKFHETRFIKFLRFQPAEVTEGDEVAVVGWGVNSVNNKVLQWLKARVTDLDTCGPAPVDDDFFVCIQRVSQTSQARQGDPGSPAFFKGKLVAAISMGIPAGNSSAFFSEMSSYHDWISNKLKENRAGSEGIISLALPQIDQLLLYFLFLILF